MCADKYAGIDNDRYGGMSDIGKVIRDAWVFGLIPEQETCAGWQQGELESLWAQVNIEWERYGFKVNGLPDELKVRYLQIHQQAVNKARAAGWDPDNELGED